MLSIQVLQAIALLCQVGNNPHWDFNRTDIYQLECQKYYVQCIGGKTPEYMARCVLDRKVK